MIRKHAAAIFITALSFITSCNANPTTQQVGICSNPQAQAQISEFLNTLWIAAAEEHDAKTHDPTSAAKLLPSAIIEKIKTGTSTKIIEIYPKTAENKLPVDCLAIVKATITTANKSFKTPAFPMTYSVNQSRDGKISVQYYKGSPDYELMQSVGENLALP